MTIQQRACRCAAKIRQRWLEAQSEPPQPVPIPPVEAAQTGGISTALLIGGAVVALVVIGAVVLGGKHHSGQPASA